MPSLRVNSPAA